MSTHTRLELLEQDGYVVLDRVGELPDPAEWEGLDYIDWVSGGDTRFAILASVNGDEREARYRFTERPDKDALWTPQADRSPSLKRWVEDCGARYGRVRVIHQGELSYDETISEHLHQDNNNAFNPEGEGWVVRAWLELTDDPDSFMVLRDSKDDVASERRIPLPAGSQVVVDSERLWHVVCHSGTRPRCALIASFESGPELERWMGARMGAGLRA